MSVMITSMATTRSRPYAWSAAGTTHLAQDAATHRPHLVLHGPLRLLRCWLFAATLGLVAHAAAADDSFATINPAGVAVAIGLPDAATLTKLTDKGRLAVQCLVATEVEATAARKSLKDSGLLGVVTVLPLSGAVLPQPSSTVDLVLIADERIALPATELQRVLAPLGVTCQQKGGQWTRTVKPWSEAMGEVRSPLNRNATPYFFEDTSLHGPFEVAWLSGPTWGEGIATGPFASISTQGVTILGSSVAMLAKTANGPRPNTKEKYLIVRNGFNGVLLWERALASAGQIGSNATTVFIQQKDQVLALDLRSGEQRYVIDKPKIQELVCNGPVVALLGKGQPLIAYEAGTGKQLWQKEGVSGIGPCDAQTLYLSNQQGFLAVDAATGAVRWQRAKADLVAKDNLWYVSLGSGIVGLQGKETFYALDAKTGATRWSHPFTITGGNTLLKRLLIRHKDGVVYLDKEGFKAADGAAAGTLGTTPDNACSATMTTVNLGIDSRMNVFDFAGKPLTPVGTGIGATRMPCGGNSIIANGLIYGLPSECACNPGQIQAYAAFGNSRGTFDEALFAKPLVAVKGPGFAKTSAIISVPDDWSEYGGNSARDFATAGDAPTKLKPLWKTAIFPGPRLGPIALSWRASGQTGLTPPVVAAGLVFSADIEGNQLHALDTKTGALRWSFSAAARITVPPTLVDGRCLFGGNDGIVYCLDAVSGALRWQVRLAPDDRRLLAFGQWESPWPVLSGISVVNGVAQAVAGLTVFAHGGLVTAAIKVDTGEVVWNRLITETWRNDWTGGLNQLLQSDGKLVYRGGTSLVQDPKKGAWPNRQMLCFPRPGGLSDVPEMKAYESWRAKFVPTSFPGVYGIYLARAMAQDAAGILEVGWMKVESPQQKASDRQGIALFDQPDGKGKKDELPTPRWEAPQPAERGFQGAVLSRNAAIALLSHTDKGIEVASELIVYDRANGKVLDSVVIPEVAAHGGLAVSAKRIYVTTRSGSVYAYGEGP